MVPEAGEYKEKGGKRMAGTLVEEQDDGEHLQAACAEDS